MALKITEQNGIFIAEGSINSGTSEFFQNHFIDIIDKYKKVTINIDKINRIDTDGLLILREFHLNALRYNRDFLIVGLRHKEIYDKFKFDKVA